MEVVREYAFKVYVTDALRIIANNSARYAGGHTLEKRFSEILDPTPIEMRTAEEIVDDVLQKTGIKVLE